MKLTEVEKAAVLLIALGPERSRPILDRLGTGDLIPIVDAMKRMRTIPYDVRRTVLLEVNRILHKLSGGKPSASPKAASDPAEALLRRLGPLLPGQIDPDRAAWDDGPDEGPQWEEPELPGPPRLPGDES